MFQVSQSTVRVNTSVTTTQCVGMYQVDVTREDGGSSSSVSSSTPLLPINELDLCRYDYNFTAKIIITGDGVPGNVSASVRFTADLSGKCVLIAVACALK